MKDRWMYHLFSVTPDYKRVIKVGKYDTPAKISQAVAGRHHWRSACVQWLNKGAGLVYVPETSQLLEFLVVVRG